jgi:hypothetical protein
MCSQVTVLAKYPITALKGTFKRLVIFMDQKMRLQRIITEEQAPTDLTLKRPKGKFKPLT